MSVGSRHADTLFYGSVITMDRARPRAGGVAVKGGTILAVGTAAQLHEFAGPGTRVVNLGSRTLAPGLHDAHVHLTGTGEELDHVQMYSAATLDEALARVRERAAQLGPDEWIRGAGFALHRWGLTTVGRREADALEAAAGGRPVLLASQDHHSAWASREALRRAGLTADTSVESGVIVLDEDGEPSGLLLEEARDLLDHALPQATPAVMRRWLQRAADHLASFGITTVHHMAAEPAAYFRQLALAASDPEFALRVWACIPHAQIEAAAEIGLATGQGGHGFTLGGAKFFADGALGSRTAWMLEPYGQGENRGSNRGMAVDGPDVLAERVPLAIEAGLTPVTHAIGDAATRAVVDAYEANSDAWRQAGLRPRLEHAQHMHPNDVSRAGAMGLVASMQPIHLTFDVDSIGTELGDRLERAYPMRSLAAAGAVLAFGSDTPVAPPDPFEGMRAAARRAAPSGRRLNLGEALGPDEALQAYTAGAAYAIGAEERSGKVAPGYDADLVVLSHDPTVSLDGLAAVATMKAGRFTHGADALEG